MHEYRVRPEAEIGIDRDEREVTADILKMLEVDFKREMNEDTAYLMGTKFLHCAANFVGAFLLDPAEHHAPADFFNALLKVDHDLRGAIESGTERDNSDD